MKLNGITKSGVLAKGKPATMQKIGYEDAFFGRPINPAIAILSEIDQKNYHNGRLMFLNVRAADLQPVVWPKTAKGIPTKIDHLAGEARKIVGSATNLQRMPVDPDLKFNNKFFDRRGFPNPIPTYCEK